MNKEIYDDFTDIKEEDLSEDEKVSDEELQAMIEEIGKEIDEDLDRLMEEVENEEDSEEIIEIFSTNDTEKRIKALIKHNPDMKKYYNQD